MSKIWVISDTHFGHTNIIAHCDRPYVSVQEMDKDLIARWNSVVRPQDTVIHCGDVGFMMKTNVLKEIVDQLNGYKILIKGNHDLTRTKMMEIGFNIVVSKLMLDDIEFRHAPQGFDYERPERKIIYGHVHNNPHARPSRKCFNASVENINYTPVDLAKIKLTGR